MRRASLALLLLVLLPAALAAQASVFGVRGLGFPGRNISAHAWGLSGATGLFDGESSQNPASLGNLRTLTANFVVVPEWRSVTTPAGHDGLRDTQFPLLLVGGPIPGGRVNLGLSFGSYADRDYTLVSQDTIDIRGVPTAVSDSFFSLGGLNEIRAAGSYTLSPRWTIGAGIHVITGSNRLHVRRAFEDSAFATSSERAELSYAGYGVSVGVQGFVRNNLSVALLARSDVKANVDRDSTRAYSVDLPYTLAAGLYYRMSPSLTLAGQGTYRTWSGANSDLIVAGGLGSKNTLELSAGAEYLPDPRRPTRRPVRVGIRYAQLPFPLTPGNQPHEVSASIGTGFRFAAERGGMDLALERAWRRADGGHTESAWLLVLGVTLRPSLSQ